MKTHIRTTTMIGLLALAGGPSIAELQLASPAQAALSPAAYAVSALCSTPSPGHAGCLGLRLVAKAPPAVPGTRALRHARPSPSGGRSRAFEFTEPIPESLTPGILLTAYGLSGSPPPASAQTIGIVDAYDDPTAAADLEHYDSRFALPACTNGDGCFRKVNQEGAEAPLPPSNSKGEEPEAGWAQEIATDIEVAHGVCQSCHILLVEANSNSYKDLFAAENTAARLGASEISNSWGGPEEGADSAAFNHPGVVITASSGDDGYRDWLAEPEASFTAYPASSPHVIAVGGTRLLTKPGGSWRSETVWNDGGESAGGVKEGFGAGGGGCSVLFAAPPWQQHVSNWSSVGCESNRAVADVSADADPYTGVAVYDSTEDSEGNKGWGVIGGTSVASPIIASVFALAGGAQGVEYPARTLYENAVNVPASLHDVTSGSNGECLRPFDEETGASGCSVAEEAQSCAAGGICLAGPGYDGPSGVGTPDGIGAFQPSSPLSGGEGGGAPSPLPAAASSGVASPGATPSAAAPPLPAPALSALTLTRSAIVALNRARPRVSRVSFAFTLNVAARVRVTLARRVRVRGRMQWKTVSPALMLLASPGRESRHLNGRGVLSSGRYKLTLTPTRGNVASIVFQIG
ncbi:MAG: S8 family serine peptidase [Solirubrobacterales bacterium]